MTRRATYPCARCDRFHFVRADRVCYWCRTPEERARAMAQPAPVIGRPDRVASASWAPRRRGRSPGRAPADQARLL